MQHTKRYIQNSLKFQIPRSIDMWESSGRGCILHHPVAHRVTSFLPRGRIAKARIRAILLYFVQHRSSSQCGRALRDVGVHAFVIFLLLAITILFSLASASSTFGNVPFLASDALRSTLSMGLFRSCLFFLPFPSLFFSRSLTSALRAANNRRPRDGELAECDESSVVLISVFRSTTALGDPIMQTLYSCFFFSFISNSRARVHFRRRSLLLFVSYDFKYLSICAVRVE